MIKRFAALLSVLTLLLVAVPTSAFAYDPFGGVDCNNASSSTVCKSQSSSSQQASDCSDPSSAACQNDNPISGSNGILMKVIDVVALVAGIAAVIIIVIAGLRMVTSGGGDGVAGARRALIGAAIGLVVIIMARELVAFVIGKIS